MKRMYRPPVVSLRKTGHGGFEQRNGNNNIKSCSRGFTLIEVIVAFTILSVSLVMVMQLFSAGLKASRASCDYTRAVIYAKDIMEEISGSPEDESGEFEDGFIWETEVMPYEDSEGIVENILQIKVKVSWADVLRRDKTIELVSLKAIVDEEAL